MIMAEFGLDYSSAKEFLAELIDRCWIEKEGEGGYYTVIPENMKLRRIERKEVDTLYGELNYELINIMRRISEAKYLTEEELYASAIRRVKGKSFLTKLVKLRLISQCRDGYMLCVSTAAVDVMADVVAAKELIFDGDEGLTDEEAEADIKKKFDILFDDE